MPRPTRGTNVSRLFGNTQKAAAFGALNIRGILTPACALAQNDRAILACNDCRSCRPKRLSPQSLAEFAAAAANKFLIIFCRGTYVAENTSQAASVRVVRLWRTRSARGRLQSPCRKAPRGFPTAKRGCKKSPQEKQAVPGGTACKNN